MSKKNGISIPLALIDLIVLNKMISLIMNLIDKRKVFISNAKQQKKNMVRTILLKKNLAS